MPHNISSLLPTYHKIISPAAPVYLSFVISSKTIKRNLIQFLQINRVIHEDRSGVGIAWQGHGSLFEICR